jgi:septal ring factor EnvC (AmiA/AmiB activator)
MSPLLPLLLLFGTLIAIPAPSLAGSEGELSNKTQQLEKLKARINRLRENLKKVAGARDEQSSALQRTEQKIGDISRRIRVLGQSLKRQQRRMSELEQQRADARLRLDQHRQVMERQIRAAYAMGRQEKIKILLNQQDPSVVSRVMVYYDYLNRARLEQIGLVKQGLIQLNEIEREIVAEEQRLQQLQAKQEVEKHQLELAQAGRQKVIAGLDRELKDTGKELEGLKENEKQLQSLLSNLQQALEDIPLDQTDAHNPFKTRKGKLPWPSKGRLAASFGSAKASGKLRWDGVLIAAPEGREVRSVHHGRVAFADWLRGFGLLLIIDHGDGYMTLYGYNQSLFKETGEWVEPGEVVAQVGRSGGRSLSGVYFGIRHNGKPKDPKRWCRRIKGKRVSVGSGYAPHEIRRHGYG